VSVAERVRARSDEALGRPVAALPESSSSVKDRPCIDSSRLGESSNERDTCRLLISWSGLAFANTYFVVVILNNQSKSAKI
jgi:hypothetical protein